MKRVARLLLALIVLVSLATGSAHGDLRASHRSGVAAGAPRMPATMIACFDQGSKKFIDKIQPSNCEIAGYEVEHGHRWVRIPVDGIRWNEWGVGNTPSNGAEDPHTGAEIELFAYRRIRCGDGRTFYSRASAINLRSDHSIHLRLPICDDLKPRP